MTTLQPRCETPPFHNGAFLFGSEKVIEAAREQPAQLLSILDREPTALDLLLVAAPGNAEHVRDLLVGHSGSGLFGLDVPVHRLPSFLLVSA